MLQSTLDRVFREHSTSAHIRAAEPIGFDDALWQILVEQGIPALRLPEPQGGASLMHGVVVAEQAGRYLASVPVVESIVANGLLSRLGSKVERLLDECLAGKSMVTLALQELGSTPTQFVPGGAVATHVLCLAGDDVVLLNDFHVLQTTMHAGVGSAKLELTSATPIGRFTGTAVHTAFLAAVEEWRLLNAAQVAAAGRRAVELAAQYACEREAFGRKIGEYQGVSHALANVVTDLDGARLLIWRAVDKIAHGAADAGACVAMAAWWSGAAARPAAVQAMRVFGGYGMAMEYDAQLYFRKVNAWSLLAESAEQQLSRVAGRLWFDAYVPLPDAGDGGIDFDWGDDAREAAGRMRAFVAGLDNAGLEQFMRDSLDGFDRNLYKAMASEGLLYPDYPKEIGGPGLSVRAASAVYEVQSAENGWHMLAQSATEMIGKIVHQFATEEAKREILPRIISGDVYCSLGYTEPSNGSDIFAVRTTARRESEAPGADWLINGQKMFTSVGHVADYSLMITRTAPDKYRGITVFIVPLRQPGYECTEIKTIGGERTNVTFYHDLRVPDRYRIGDVNGGVKVVASALTLEQSSGDTYLHGMRKLLGSALHWAQSANMSHGGRRPIDEEALRLLLAELVVRLQVGESLSRFSVWAFEAGTARKHDGPMAKLFCSESFLWSSEKLLAACAPDSLEVGYNDAGVVEWLSRRSISGTIYAGTSEIQRSIVAESALGLPRTRG